MADEANLVVRVSNQGIHETTSALAGLSAQGKTTGDSFGSLALKIAGYSTALNLGVNITRRALTELKDLGVQAVQLAGSFERSRVAWGVFLKDVEAGSQMFDRLYDVAQRTPLTFQGVESAAQMLKGFGLATEEIIPTLERMGDVARGNDETMQRLALAYGQALAQNRVLTRDLYQFVNAGVPIFEALAQVMGKTVHEVGILVSDGKVGFPEIEKALKALTDEGGQFHGMMEKTAETFEGKLSIAADNFKAVLSTIGREAIPTLKTALDELNTTMDTMISKSNALYYLRTGQGDPVSLIAGLKTIMERNSAAAENPLTKLTGFNWNIFHTAPDGGWQPLYGPKYENELLQAIIDQIEAQQAESGYSKAEQNRQNYRPPTASTSDRVPWRDVLVGQGIAAYERPWVPTDQGTMVRGEMFSGTDLVKQFLEQQKLGFENVRGTKFEEEFRKRFTTSAENLQEAMLTSGLWKVGEATYQVIEDYINQFGYKKDNKDAFDSLKALQALYTKGAKGQSGIAPPGDWSNVPSIAAQMAAMGYDSSSIGDEFTLNPPIERKQPGYVNPPAIAAYLESLGTTKVSPRIQGFDEAPYATWFPERDFQTYPDETFGGSTLIKGSIPDRSKMKKAGSPYDVGVVDESLYSTWFPETYEYEYKQPEFSLFQPAPYKQNPYAGLPPATIEYLKSLGDTKVNPRMQGFDEAPYATWFPETYEYEYRQPEFTLNSPIERKQPGYVIPPAIAAYLETIKGEKVGTPYDVGVIDESLYASRFPENLKGYNVEKPYTDAEKYREALDNLELNKAQYSTEGYNQALKELAEQYDPLTKAAISFGDALRDTAINTFADELYNLGSALVSGADGWESFGDAMSNTLETLLQMLPKLAIQVGLSMLGNANPADDPLAIGLIAGGLVGQVGAGMMKPNAQGGVYASPSLSMYSNNVYDKPQVFAFAKGGIFAEAGPEAIMPLSRDSSGRLGVTAQSAGKVEVQINNYSSTPIASKTKTVTDASGNRKIILTIRDMVRQEVATANAGGVRKS